MARKVVKPEKPAEPGADDLQVLHPERSPIIAGRQVTVREYGFIEGLGLRPLAQPFLDELHERGGDHRVPVLPEVGRRHPCGLGDGCQL